jgi:hypothetical protein
LAVAAVAGVVVAAAVAVAGVAVAAGAVVAAAGADKEDEPMPTPIPTWFVRGATLVAVVIATSALAADAPGAKRFGTPEEAVRALAKAARGTDQTAVLAILGPGGEDIASSGDPVEDRAARQRFVTAVGEKLRIETIDERTAVANIGRDDWPFPVPLVHDPEGWRFDAPAARDEIVNRRVGRHELDAIESCRAYVEAQREYARVAGAGAYAQKVRSEPGKRDGLYWQGGTDRGESPLGPLFAEAAAEGYALHEAPATPAPFHGYMFRILTAQGKNAPGGARSWVKDGRMTGGFGLVAYPADPGVSGVMTFVVGPEGIVFQKNLGEKTVEVAKAIAAYDPDDSWTPVRD